jgi:hypothetical protein
MYFLKLLLLNLVPPSLKLKLLVIVVIVKTTMINTGSGFIIKFLVL